MHAGTIHSSSHSHDILAKRRPVCLAAPKKEESRKHKDTTSYQLKHDTFSIAGYWTSFFGYVDDSDARLRLFSCAVGNFLGMAHLLYCFLLSANALTNVSVNERLLGPRSRVHP